MTCKPPQPTLPISFQNVTIKTSPQNVTIITTAGQHSSPAAVALPRPDPGVFVLVQLVNVSMTGFDRGSALISSVEAGCVGAATALINVTAWHRVRDTMGDGDADDADDGHHRTLYFLRRPRVLFTAPTPQNGTAQPLLLAREETTVLLDVDGSVAGQGPNMLLTRTAPWLVNAGCTPIPSIGGGLFIVWVSLLFGCLYRLVSFYHLGSFYLLASFIFRCLPLPPFHMYHIVQQMQRHIIIIVCLCSTLLH